MLDRIYHSLDPIAFSVGPLTVRWYGLAYMAAFLCAALIIYATARHWKLKFNSDTTLTIILCAMVGVIVGARLGYVLFYGNGYYLQHPGDILMVSKGGMSFHGGLIGAFVAGIVAARLTRVPYLTVTDLAVVGTPIGLFFGRCANFVNGELWGAVTDLPWGVVFGGVAGEMPRHPTQLYEALLEGLVIFVVLFALSRRLPPRPRGTFTGLFFVMYGCFRFLIEFVRQPDAQLGYLAGGWLTMGMVLSVPLVIVGIALLVWVNRVKLPQQGVNEPPASEEVR